MTRLLQEDGDWVAEIEGAPGRRWELRQGDLITEGEVVAVSEKGLFVEVRWTLDDGKRVEKRLLRFTPPVEPAAVTLGHDTTRITSPMLPDGTPDYGKWLNDEYGAGVTEQNNAAVALRAAFDELVDAGNTFWDDVAFRGGKRG